MSFRGLRNFVQEIRVSFSHDYEMEIINTEKQKIRTYFSYGNNSSYDTQKYALKMMYMSILGYNIDFGLVPISYLMASKDKQEKLTGYIALQQLIRDVPDFLRLVTQTILSDIYSDNVFAACLALDFVANDGNAAMAEVLAGPILNLIYKEPEKVPAVVRKKALLGLVQLFRQNPDAVATSGAEEILMKLMDQKNVGFLTCLMHLLDSLYDASHFIPIKHRMIYLMTKIIIKREVTDDHIYYTMPCPWLLISLMRFLQKMPPELGEAINPRTSVIEDETEMITMTINKCFELVSKVGTTGLQSKINIHWALALEAAKLYAFYKNSITQEFDLKFMFDVIRSTSVASNIKYAAFNCLTTMSSIGYVMYSIKTNLYDIAHSVIGEKDYAVRHRGLVLLYNQADRYSAQAVVSALCYAANQAATPVNYREDAVLRAIQLCEQYRKDFWVIPALLKILPDCHEMKQFNIWKNLANIIQIQVDKESYYKILQAIMSNCINTTLDRVTEDKLALAVFCFAFQEMHYFMSQEEVVAAVRVIYQAAYLLQSKETAELYCLAANAILVCVGKGVVDYGILQLLVYSEVVEVYQRACEAYVLVQQGQQAELCELYRGVLQE